MARATSVNDNLINKRGTYDDSQVSTAEADIIVSQNSGLALAGLEVGGIERQQHILNILEFIIVLSLKKTLREHLCSFDNSRPQIYSFFFKFSTILH